MKSLKDNYVAKIEQIKEDHLREMEKFTNSLSTQKSFVP